MTVEGLDEEATDSRVCVDKVLEAAPKCFSSFSGSDVEDSTGSTGGDLVFSGSESAINKLRDNEGVGTQPEFMGETSER